LLSNFWFALSRMLSPLHIGFWEIVLQQVDIRCTLKIREDCG